MKSEKAIEALNEILDVSGYSHYSNSREYIAVDTAIQALEKQVPKKPLSIYGEYTCPMCEVTIAEKDDYCYNCGQRIDWSVEE